MFRVLWTSVNNLCAFTSLTYAKDVFTLTYVASAAGLLLPTFLVVSQSLFFIILINIFIITMKNFFFSRGTQSSHVRKGLTAGLAFTALFTFSQQAEAQWNGPNNPNSSINRSGNVGIGESIGNPPSDVQLEIGNLSSEAVPAKLRFSTSQQTGGEFPGDPVVTTETDYDYVASLQYMQLYKNDTKELIWSAAPNRVGIGLAFPSANLHVKTQSEGRSIFYLQPAEEEEQGSEIKFSIQNNRFIRSSGSEGLVLNHDATINMRGSDVNIGTPSNTSDLRLNGSFGQLSSGIFGNPFGSRWTSIGSSIRQYINLGDNGNSDLYGTFSAGNSSAATIGVNGEGDGILAWQDFNSAAGSPSNSPTRMKFGFFSGISTTATFNEYMTILADGCTGIATSAPTVELSVNGIANKPGGGTWAIFSDARLKENVSDYSEGLELIMQVNPKNFSYNQSYTDAFGNAEGIRGQVYQGVIAQELQEIAPDMVSEVEADEQTYLQVDPNRFTYALINAVQQQQAEIEELRTMLQNGSGRVGEDSRYSGYAMGQSFPNPTNDVATIELTIPESVQRAEVMVTDLTGRQIISKPVRGSELQFSKSELGAGIFLYSLLLDGELVDTKKMTIK